MSRVRTEAALALGGSMERYDRYLEPFYLMTGTSDVATASANRCWYSPIQVPFLCTVDGIVVAHGGVASGDVMTALYDSSLESPTDRLAVSAVESCNGTNRKQFVAFTSRLQITPAYYFLAGWTSTTDTYEQNVRIAGTTRPAGVDDGPSWYFEAAGAGGPPATATPTQADAGGETIGMLLRVHSVP